MAMHAPDGLFSMPVNVVFAVVAVVWVGLALTKLKRRADHRLAPTMGVMAAFIFAAQMVNFPIASGTTGHLLGGTLAATLLGPWAGTVVMAIVILFQALLGDGGVTALGPNIFNMGIIGTSLAYGIYRLVLGGRTLPAARVIAAAFFAAWLAVVLASVFVSLQLAASGTVSLNRALVAMMTTHMVIGVGEALITAAVLAFVLKTRPHLVREMSDERRTPINRAAVLAGLVGSLAVAAVLSLLPALWDHPDGLESVGLAKGFLLEDCQKAEDGSLQTLPAYPLGVRLETVNGAVTAVHQYAKQAGPISVGDVLVSLNARTVPDLAAAAAALRFDEPTKTFGIRPGSGIEAIVRRAGQRQALSFPAAPSPVAGTLPPPIALLPDYTVPGVGGLISTSLAGTIGTIVVFCLSLVVGRLFTRPGRLELALAHSELANSDRSRSG
jgi:cobalt/nickel transport system permease protein